MSRLKENWKRLSTSHGAAVTVVVVGEVMVGLLIFHAGISYGERHAFGRMNPGKGVPPMFGFGFLPHSFMPAGHGAVGIVSSVTPPTFMIEERDGDHDEVLVGSSTNIRSEGGLTEVQVGDAVIVIGEPNHESRQINAVLIRILPAPPPAQ